MRTSDPYLRRIVKELRVRNADSRDRKSNFAKNLVDSIPKYRIKLR